MPFPALPAIDAIGAAGSIRAPSGPARGAGAAAPGFGDALQRGLQQVSGLEHGADAMTQAVATGSGQIHEMMIATTKAQLGVELLAQVRNRAVEAYQEIMRLQV